MNEAKAKEGLEAKPESLESSGLSMSQGKDRTRGLCLARKASDTEEKSNTLLEFGIAIR